MLGAIIGLVASSPLQCISNVGNLGNVGNVRSSAQLQWPDAGIEPLARPHDDAGYGLNIV